MSRLLDLASRLWNWISYLWKNPTGYRGQPIKYARNQIGHFGIVGAIPVALGVSPLLVIALFALWEMSQWHLFDAEPRDCLEDWCFVAAGALSAVNFLIGFWIGLAAVVALLVGIAMRFLGRA